MDILASWEGGYYGGADTVIDDQEDASKWEGVVKLDADKDFTLKEVDAKEDAKVQGRLLESQAQIYHLDMEHAQKVLKVVTTATTTITAAPIPKASAPRRRRGMIIQDPQEASTTSLSVQSEVKSKDK
nr:hypothetical protein [Tanacetum cinerariifolium]